MAYSPSRHSSTSYIPRLSTHHSSPPAKLYAHTGSPPHTSPLLLLPSPPHPFSLPHAASSSSPDGMEGWPVLTHFSGKNSQIERATHDHHDANREKAYREGMVQNIKVINTANGYSFLPWDSPMSTVSHLLDCQLFSVGIVCTFSPF